MLSYLGTDEKITFKLGKLTKFQKAWDWTSIFFLSQEMNFLNSNNVRTSHYSSAPSNPLGQQWLLNEVRQCQQTAVQPTICSSQVLAHQIVVKAVVTKTNQGQFFTLKLYEGWGIPAEVM